MSFSFEKIPFFPFKISHNPVGEFFQNKLTSGEVFQRGKKKEEKGKKKVGKWKNKRGKREEKEITR